jgi:C4-dicarboxylate transporter, DctQ subunit
MLDRIANNVVSIVVVVLSLAALGVGTMQVVLRYVFNTGFPWSEGIFVMLTVWAMLLAGIRTARDGLHVRVDVALMLMPPAVRKVSEGIAVAAAIALSGYYAYCGALYIQFVWSIDATSAETYLPVWVIYLVVPVCMIGFCLRYLYRIALWRRIGVPPCEEISAATGREHDSAKGHAA